jgi:hypothetical protein
VIELPPGTSVDDSVPELCEASDQELIATGAGACPEGSVIGGGELDVDTGIDGPARTLANTVTVFNAEGQLILLLDSTSGAPRRLVTRSVVEGRTITTEVPPTPGGPPDGFAAIKRVRLRLEPVSRGGASYLTTPPICPAGGSWTTTLTFTYRDDGSYAVASPSPCAQRASETDRGEAPARARQTDRTPPRIRLRGIPRRRCARRGFTVRVGVQETGSGLRSVSILRDGRRLAAGTRPALATRIRTRGLRRGRHTITAVAVDRAGNRAVRTVRFRRCRT